jgi:hypothetical protein
VFNTIGNLTTQEQQIACFANAAAYLQSGGRFVVEVGVPQLRRLPPGERHVVFHADGARWGIDEYDTASQRLISHHLRHDGTGPRHRAIPFGYVWPPRTLSTFAARSAASHMSNLTERLCGELR